VLGQLVQVVRIALATEHGGQHGLSGRLHRVSTVLSGSGGGSSSSGTSAVHGELRGEVGARGK